MQLNLQVFNFHSDEEEMLSEIRSVDINGEIWFVGNDIAKKLGYKNVSDALSRHCKPKGIVKHDVLTEGGNQSMILINEPNVYRLIVKSTMPAAEKFEEWLFEEVVPSIRKKGYYGKIDRTQLPNFITRYKDNYHKLPNDHFSVISEMYVRLYIELEKVGYSIPDRGEHGKQMMPDISVGRGFANFLKEVAPEFYDTHKTYTHTFPDGREVEANMYHMDALGKFNRYIHERWIPENAESYFKSRDPLALGYLPKLLSGSNHAALAKN